MTMRRQATWLRLASCLLAAGGLASAWLGLAGQAASDFDLSTHSVPPDQIVAGGPGKDGIPAILRPRFVPASRASFLASEDRVLGLLAATEAKAYPIKILNWHEIVNDTIEGRPVLVTYCPLCGSGIAFDRRVQGRTLTFGVSGLLYQSDLLMYDHQTNSLWSQLAMQAVAGPLTGVTLTALFLEHTTWGEWRATHPATVVLSTQMGHRRDYDRDPYLGYSQRADLMFATTHRNDRYHPKEWIVGVEINGTVKAYPFSELARTGQPVTDQVAGRTLRIHFNARAQSASVTDAAGAPIPTVTAFWFAWYAFHPDTQVYSAPR